MLTCLGVVVDVAVGVRLGRCVSILPGRRDEYDRVLYLFSSVLFSFRHTFYFPLTRPIDFFPLPLLFRFLRFLRLVCLSVRLFVSSPLLPWMCLQLQAQQAARRLTQMQEAALQVKFVE